MKKHTLIIIGVSLTVVLSSNCTIATALRYGEGIPNNTSDGLNTKLAIKVNGTQKDYWDIIFLTNDTINGSWVIIRKYSDVLISTIPQTISTYFSGLDWNKTYWWRVSAYNPRLGIYSNSTIFSFQTRSTDPEPNITYYSIGAQIRIVPSTPDIERSHYRINPLLAIVPVLLSLYLVFIIKKKNFPDFKIHLFNLKKS